MSKNIYQTPLFNALLFALFWALNIFLSKVAFLSGANPMVLTLQSAIVCLIVLAIYILPKKTYEIKNIKRNILIGLLVAFGIHGGLGGFLSNAGTDLTTAINAGFLVRFALITTTFFAWLFLREKITLSQIITIILLFVGTFLISTNGQLIIPHFGDILILMACLSWSIGNVYTRKVLKNTTVDAEASTLLRPVAMIPTLLFFIIISPLYPQPVHTFFVANYLDLHYAFWSIIVGLTVVLNWIFLNRTLKVASASFMTMMGMLTPVFVTILAIVFLHESMTTIQIIGALLVIIAGIATNYLGVHKH